MVHAPLLILASLISAASGSRILIDANPDVIQSNLTKSMTLRCSLNDTDPVPVSGGVIGRRAIADVEYTPENMQTLTSIVITRNNGDPVASLITGQQPKAQTDLNNIQVYGSLSATGQPGEEGYIELTWNYPTTAQQGEYVCEINAIDAMGHPVTFKDNVEVIETTPTIGQLISHIQNLEKTSTETKTKIQQLTKKKTDIENLLAQVCPGHLQVHYGQVECGDSSTWTTDSHGPHDNWPAKSTTRHVTFDPPYEKTPRVEVGVVALNHDNGANTRYEATVTNLDRAGFDVHCETWFDSRIYKFTVSFLSVSQ